MPPRDASPAGPAPSAEDTDAALLYKLGIGPGTALTLVHAPTGVLSDLPVSVEVSHQMGGSADVVVAFFAELAALEGHLGELGQMVFPDGALWIAWPKRASGVATDLTDRVVRELALPHGLVDNKVCRVDDVWSALRVVWRRERR